MEFKLIILPSIYGKLIYFEILIDIKQLGYKRLKFASYICIKYVTKMVNKIQLNCVYPLKDKNILEDNQSNKILFGSLFK